MANILLLLSSFCPLWVFIFDISFLFLSKSELSWLLFSLNFTFSFNLWLFLLKVFIFSSNVGYLLNISLITELLASLLAFKLISYVLLLMARIIFIISSDISFIETFLSSNKFFIKRYNSSMELKDRLSILKFFEVNFISYEILLTRTLSFNLAIYIPIGVLSFVIIYSFNSNMVSLLSFLFWVNGKVFLIFKN